MGYYVLSSFLAASVGLLMVNFIRPGVGANLTGTDQQELPDLATPDSAVQLLLDIVPQNVIQAAATADMLALIFFCIVFGAALTTLPDKTREPLVQFFDALFHVMMNLTSGIIKFLPIGVFALITRMVGTTGFDAFRPLAMYALTIGSGVTIHFLVSLPILLIVLGRISPRIHFLNMREPLLIAFSTSSSGATLPVTMKVVEEKVGVSNKSRPSFCRWGRRSTWTARRCSSVPAHFLLRKHWDSTYPLYSRGSSYLPRFWRRSVRRPCPRPGSW